MSYRYRLDDTERGTIAGRFNSLDRALREVRAAVGAEGRFVLVDRVDGTEVARSGGGGWLAK
jgi:hypothetical protein